MFYLPRFTHWLLASLAICLLLAPPAMAQKVKKQLTAKLVPNSVSINGAVTGTVTHNTSTGSAVTVSLTSSNASAVSMPAAVTINAGQSSASFTITAGAIPQTVTITAAAGGFQSGSASLTINAPSPVAFELTFLPVNQVSRLSAINSMHQVVGWSYNTVDGLTRNEGFLYDHYDAQPIKRLADLIPEETMAELLVAGFAQSRFHQINDNGWIVGDISSADNTLRVGIVINAGTGAIQFASGPDFDFAFGTSLYRINNLGELLGGGRTSLENNTAGYQTFLAQVDQTNGEVVLKKNFGCCFNTVNRSKINDFGLVMLSPDAYVTLEYDILNDVLTQVSDDADRVILSDIDSAGRYAGWVSVTTRRNTTIYPCIFDPLAAHPHIVWQGTASGIATALNDPSPVDIVNGVTFGDVLYHDTHGPGLRNPVLGELNVTALIDPTDPDLTAWQNYTGFDYLQMSQKIPETNFGAIAGLASASNLSARAFILVPKPVTE